LGFNAQFFMDIHDGGGHSSVGLPASLNPWLKRGHFRSIYVYINNHDMVLIFWTLNDVARELLDGYHHNLFHLNDRSGNSGPDVGL